MIMRKLTNIDYETMKKITILFCLLLSLSTVSCVTYNGPGNDGTPPDVAHFQTSEEFTIPVKTGYVTQVVMGGEIIAEAVSPMTILLPRKSPAGRAADGLELVYIPFSEYPNEVPENKSKLYQVICFEDSKAGDYDYNDLVIHVLYKQQGIRFGFGVQPVALGSTKPIKLGCAVYKGKTLLYKGLITPEGKNCRQQYFKDQEGFINTVGDTPNSEEYKKGYLGSTIRNWKIDNIADNGPMRVEWYIEVDNGVELFALSTNYINKSFDKKGLPYGLVITSTGNMYEQNGELCGFDWFNYPKEGKSMEEVYPGLWNWMTTDASYNFFKDVYDGNYVPPTAFPASDLGLFVTVDADVCNSKYTQN